MDAVLSPSRLAHFWKGPAIGALTAAALSLPVSLAFSALVYYSLVSDVSVPKNSPLELIFRFAGQLPYYFEGVAARYAVEDYTGSVDRGRIVITGLGGLLFMGIALVVGGYIAAKGTRTIGGRILRGGALGIPFAVLACAVSFFVTIELQDAYDNLYLEVQNTDAFWYSLFWGTVFGAIGGLRRTYPKRTVRSALSELATSTSIWGSSVRGGVSAFAGGCGFAACGLLAVGMILGITNYDAVQDVFGDWNRVLQIVTTLLLFWPNLLVSALLASMGSSLEVLGAGSVSIFGASADAQVDVPAYWLAAMSIPLVATARGGYVAARISADPRHALASALLSAIPFAILCWIGGALAGFNLTSPPQGQNGGGLGFSTAAVFFLPLLWGLIGGFLGALFHLRSSGLLVVAGSTGAAPPPPPPPPPEPSRQSPRTEDGYHERCSNCDNELAKGGAYCAMCGHPV